MVCVMCTNLHGSIDTCVTACYYSALVAQGVVNHVQLAQICSMYNPTFIHRKMTDSPPEDRDCMIQSFWYRYWARSKDPLRGVMGIFNDLSAELAEKIADVQKLEDELAELKLANNDKLAAEMVSDDEQRLKLEAKLAELQLINPNYEKLAEMVDKRLKLEAEMAEIQLIVKIAKKKKEVLKVEDEIVEHNFRMSGRKRRGNEQII